MPRIVVSAVAVAGVLAAVKPLLIDPVNLLASPARVRSFIVFGKSGIFVVAMAAGSIVGSFIRGDRSV